MSEKISLDSSDLNHKDNCLAFILPQPTSSLSKYLQFTFKFKTFVNLKFLLFP